ncbi:prephenate dehydratase [Clostridiaceae bacterium 35-E11]
MENQENVGVSSGDRLCVGFQGVSGSFSEQALLAYFGHNVDPYPVNMFEDVFTSLKKNQIDYGVLPIENSSTGAISQVYDLLNKYDCYIVGEICVKVNHHLLGIKGTQIKDIVEVYSHPQAFEQSSEFLNQYPHWKLIPYYNTAKSAEFVENKGSKNIAAVGSEKAAALYHLDILAANINSNTTNTTRFVVIGKELIRKDSLNKVSIVLSTEHKAGCLYNVLRHFAQNNINMLKIESRPIKDIPWEYFFYIDFEGNLEDETIRIAINSMKRDSHYFKILGNYEKYHE